MAKQGGILIFVVLSAEDGMADGTFEVSGISRDAAEWVGTQVRVTPKGLTILAKAFPSQARAARLA